MCISICRVNLLPPRTPCDFTSHRVYWPCWCPAHSSSLPPSAWWIMELWICGPCLLPTIHTLRHAHWMWCNSVMTHSVHMAYIVLFILKRDPPLLLSWRFLPFFPCESFFSICWDFFLIRCEVLGQGCQMCTGGKALWGKFIICDIQNKLNRIIYGMGDSIISGLKKRRCNTQCWIFMYWIFMK